MNKKALFIKYILDSKNTDDGFETLWTGELSISKSSTTYSTDNLYRGAGIYRLELSEYNFRSFVYYTYYDSSRTATISKQGDKLIIDITVHKADDSSGSYVTLGRFTKAADSSSGGNTSTLYISTGNNNQLSGIHSAGYNRYYPFVPNPVTPTDDTLIPTTITRIAYSPLP